MPFLPTKNPSQREDSHRSQVRVLKAVTGEILRIP